MKTSERVGPITARAIVEVHSKSRYEGRKNINRNFLKTFNGLKYKNAYKIILLHNILIWKFIFQAGTE